MTTAKQTLPDSSWCPYCGGDKCEHFVGWTEDGRVITPVAEPLRDTDHIVTTGVTARVYRNGERPCTPK